MARPEAFKEFLKDNDFTEEVEGKFIKYFNETYDEVFFGDPLDNCSVWYEEFDDFYWLGKQVSYNEFRRNLDEYNGTKKEPEYPVTESDLVYLVDCLDDKIRHLCIQKSYVPPFILESAIETWVKYNNLLKEAGGDHFTEVAYTRLAQLIALKNKNPNN